jgi:hypothetical protein
MAFGKGAQMYGKRRKRRKLVKSVSGRERCVKPGGAALNPTALEGWEMKMKSSEAVKMGQFGRSEEADAVSV